MKEGKTIKFKYSKNPFVIGLCIFGLIWFSVYYKYANGWDFEIHVNVAKYLFTHGAPFESIANYTHIFSYPVFHVFLKVFHFVTRLDYEVSLAIVLTGANVLSCHVTSLIVDRISRRKNYINDLASIFSCVFLAATGPWINWRRYAEICGPNPLHNPTVVFVRPFGLLCLLFFVQLMDKVDNKKLVLFGTFLLFSVGIKPSFAIAFLPAMGIVTLIKMIRDKTISLGIKLFITVLPSVILLLIQGMIVTQNSEALTTEFVIGGFSGFGLRQVIKVSLSTFPLVFVLFRVHKIRMIEVQTALLALLFGWAQMFFLSNGPTGDYSWGYDLAVQAATVIMFATSYEDGKIRKAIAYLLYGYQVVAGFIYIYLVYCNGDYWI